MLRTLKTYLWKEWRDHRAIVIGLFLAVPFLLAIAKLAMPGKVLDHHIFPPITALSCYLIALLSLGSDLIPGEARRNRLGFLRRLPADLTVPFIAKALFFSTVLTTFTWYGWGLACLAGKVPDKTDDWLTYVTLGSYCLAPWVFAVSSWLPRGALAVPGAVVALALFGLPLFLMYNAPYTPNPERGDIFALAYLAAGWSLVVAWVSWARGYRFGRGIGAAAWRGLAAALVLFVPVWAYAGHTIREWRSIDPQSRDFTIVSAVLSADEHTVYVNALTRLWHTGAPNHVLRVDLRTGQWTRMGLVGDRVVLPLPLRTMGESIFMQAQLRKSSLVAVIDARSSKHEPKSNHIRQAWLTYHDANSGERIKSGWQDMELPEISARFGDAWIDLPEGYKATWPSGHGYRIFSTGPTRFFDPFRKKHYAPRTKPFQHVVIRKGRWLVIKFRKGGGTQLFDPDTETSVPAKGMPDWKGRLNLQLLDDGRVVYSSGGRILLTDPETGETAVLAHDVEYVGLRGTTSKGASIFTLITKHGEFRIARLTQGSTVLEHVGARVGSPIAAFADGSLLCTHGGRLVRAHFGSDESEVLWPR